jgi:sugar O-acyltransferase (sialic acid O-acetyltransferase NeuD family)
VYYYFTHDSHYEVMAFTVDKEYITGKEYSGLPIVPFEEIELLYPPDHFKMFIALGYTSLNKLRAKKYSEAKNKGYELVSYINSSVIRWENLKIGDNCLIFENQILQPYVTIGNDTIIWGGGAISHDSIIGDHCFIASNVVVLGNVRVEPYCFLGANATIKEGITVARACVIGMGASVTRNTEEDGVYVGVPARLRSKIGSQDKFMT